MNIHTDADTLELMTRRYRHWKQCNFPHADLLMVPVLEEFMKFKGLVPVYSCEGHKDRKAWGSFYIMFAFDADGFQSLQQIFQLLRIHAIQHPNGSKSDYVLPNDIKLTLTTRSMMIDSHTFNWYSVVILGAEGTGVDVNRKCNFISDLMSVMAELLTEHIILNKEL